MENVIELELEGGAKARIMHDPDCSQPYEDDEGVRIVVLSRKYADPSKGACGSSPEAVEAWAEANPDWFVAPLWAYDHSGVAYAAAAENPFSCQWDSGRAGIVALLRSEWGDGNCSDEKLMEYASSVAGEYGRWANGECFGYVIVNADGDEEDSCWGFVGMDVVKEAAEESAQQNAPSMAA